MDGCRRTPSDPLVELSPHGGEQHNENVILLLGIAEHGKLIADSLCGDVSKSKLAKQREGEFGFPGFLSLFGQRLEQLRRP